MFKKTLLTLGLALVFLFVSVACTPDSPYTPSSTYWRDLIIRHEYEIPQRYLGKQEGYFLSITEHTPEELNKFCASHLGEDKIYLGCQGTAFNGTWCLVYIPTEESVGSRARQIVLDHEIAHCNGWPKDHPSE